MKTLMQKLALAGVAGTLALFTGCQDNSGRVEDRQLQSEGETTRIESNDTERAGSNDLSGGPEEQGTGGAGQPDEAALGGELPQEGSPEGSETHRELTGEDNSETQRP